MNGDTQTTEALLHDIREDVRSLTQAVTDLIKNIDQRASDSKASTDQSIEDMMRIFMVAMEEFMAIKAEREEDEDEIQKHIRKVTPSEFLLECKCGLAFDNESDYDKHSIDCIEEDESPK